MSEEPTLEKMEKALGVAKRMQENRELYAAAFGDAWGATVRSLAPSLGPDPLGDTGGALERAIRLDKASSTPLHRSRLMLAVYAELLEQDIRNRGNQ